MQPSRLHSAATYLIFAATGIGCALPGALLPSLIIEWRLSDLHAGTLFFLIFLGASLGALAVRGRLTQSIAAGSGLIVVAAIGLALEGTTLSAPCSFVYGLGFGLVMTAISLLRQRVRSDRRGLELVRLNLMWAVGAFITPALALRALATHHSSHLLLLEAAFFAVACAWTLTVGRSEIVLSSRSGFTVDAWRKLARVPLALILITIASPGIEAASGAWLATYAQRTAHGLAWTAAAPTCLWAGLLTSRLIGAFGRVEQRLQNKIGALLLLACLAASLIVVAPVGAGVLTGAFVLGFSLGPLYPLLLARVMAIQEAGTIFFLAGVAASSLPLLTGAVAQRAHSLRIGMTTIACVAGLAWVLNGIASLTTRDATAPEVG